MLIPASRQMDFQSKWVYFGSWRIKIMAYLASIGSNVQSVSKLKELKAHVSNVKTS